MSQNRPNILYIHSHDTGRYIQPFGRAVPTPNLQRLADQGVLFRRCCCAAPTCSPSRSAMLTGQWAHCTGMLGLAHRGFSLNDYKRHILHTLRTVGYRSTLVGIQHIADDPSRIGYDEILPVAHADVAHVAPAAVEWLERKPAGPFFLSVGFFETHRPWDKLSASADSRYVLPPTPIPDTPQTRRDTAGFLESARTLDAGIGRVLEALDKSGLADNTIVLCTTDHGIAFPRMKCNLTDHGTGVFLMLRGPGKLSGGKVCDAMVSHVDVMPTLCELVGVDRPDWAQGESMLPLLNGSADSIRDELFAEVTYHAAYEPQRCVRTPRWKYIRRFGDRRKPVLPNVDPSESKDLFLSAGWQDQDLPAEQLYDLVVDPTEECNLAEDTVHGGVLSEMRGRLDRWMRDTDDPLLAGPAAAPSGAKLNDPDGLSPDEPPRVVR
ncbi:MAG: sulfatase family protein [Phycisphaerae bacterium]